MVIALALPAVQTAQHAWRWADWAHRTLLVATLTADGTDRLLPVPGCDVTDADELSISPNRKRVGYLIQAASKTLGTRYLWWVRAFSQVSGIDRISPAPATLAGRAPEPSLTRSRS